MVRQPTFLERYFWLLLGGLFLTLFLPLLLRDWISLKAEGLYDIEWHTTALSELLHRDLEQLFPLEEALANLKDPENKHILDEHLARKIGHLGLLLVKIYDRHGKQLISTGPEKENKIHPGEGFQRALSGEVSSRMTSPEDYTAEYGSTVPETMAEVYVPITSGDERSTNYVLEAYYDYGPILARTQRLLQQRALSLATILLIVIGLLGWILRSRQKMAQKVAMLESILPICMHCKKIRVETDGKPEQWVAVESYFHRERDIDFSHGICDDCLREHYPEVDRERRKPSAAPR